MMRRVGKPSATAAFKSQGCAVKTQNEPIKDPRPPEQPDDHHYMEYAVSTKANSVRITNSDGMDMKISMNLTTKRSTIPPK